MQIGSCQLPPPFRGLHSPRVRKHCQIIFACYFRNRLFCGHSMPTSSRKPRHRHVTATSFGTKNVYRTDGKWVTGSQQLRSITRCCSVFVNSPTFSLPLWCLNSFVHSMHCRCFSPCPAKGSVLLVLFLPTGVMHSGFS